MFCQMYTAGDEGGVGGGEGGDMQTAVTSYLDKFREN